MGDNFEEIAELGFEGVDRFAAKFHDPCHDYVSKKAHDMHGNHASQHGRGGHREHSDSTNDRNKGHARSQYRDEDKDHQDRGPPSEDEYTGDAYAPGRSRDRDWEEGGGRVDRSYAAPRERGLNDAGRVGGRGRDPAAYAGGYQVAALGSPVPMAYPSPPSGAPYGDEFGYENRRPIPPRRRDSSYSPPRRAEKRQSFSPPRRQRSKSPNHHRVAATIVGALAGGMIANVASEKSGKLGKWHEWSAIGGAVIGGIGGRQLEKAYDRRKDKDFEGEERRERRERRGRKEDEWS